MSATSGRPEEGVTMTPEQERAAMEGSPSAEGTEPPDEGVGVHTDAQGDDEYTEN